MIRTNVKLQVTPEQSAKIQQICFDNRIPWLDRSLTTQHIDSKYLFIYDDGITHMKTGEAYFEDHGFEEVSAELFINTNGSCVRTTNMLFAEYGFEVPNFECKLYDKLDDYILGAYFNPNKQKWTMCRWSFDGRNKQGSYNYALKPLVINKPWYEICKFPCLIWDKFAEELQIATHVINTTVYLISEIRELEEVQPLTDTEIEELKRGF